MPTGMTEKLTTPMKEKFDHSGIFCGHDPRHVSNMRERINFGCKQFWKDRGISTESTFRVY